VQSTTCRDLFFPLEQDEYKTEIISNTSLWRQSMTLLSDIMLSDCPNGFWEVSPQFGGVMELVKVSISRRGDNNLSSE
jgi:hypothetical protein